MHGAADLSATAANLTCCAAFNPALPVGADLSRSNGTQGSRRAANCSGGSPGSVGWLSDHVFAPAQLKWAMVTLTQPFEAPPLLAARRTRTLFLQALARQRE